MNADKIYLNTQLTLDDYIKGSFHLTYSNRVIKISVGVGIFILLSFLSVLSINAFTEFPWFQLTIGLYLTIGLPISVYFSAKKNYNKHPRIKESIQYVFDNETFYSKGESFEATLTWDKIYKITESENFIFIWHSQQVANIIPKRYFKEGEFDAFKQIVKLYRTIKNKLK